MGRATIISIGNFDGVHVGHQAILSRARQVAKQRDADVLVLTFDPHPAYTLNLSSGSGGLTSAAIPPPPRLCSLHEKVERLKAGGADQVVVLEPTPQVLGQSPEQFIEHLARQYRPVAIIEGEDFRFGKGRRGDVTLLGRLGERFGFEMIVQPPVTMALHDQTLVPVRSSLIRWLIGHGRVADSGRCLGRFYQLGGEVVSGERRGRNIGVPTANLDPDAYAHMMVPAHGVYAAMVQVDSAATPGIPAAVSVGVKPSFGPEQLAIEAHLLDFDEDLYGQPITITFARWVRDQYPFGEIKLLQKQLQRDIAAVRLTHGQGLMQLSPSRAVSTS